MADNKTMFCHQKNKNIFQTKIDLTPCAASVCKEGTAQNGCFCLEAKDDVTPPTRESETETLVMILVIIRF